MSTAEISIRSIQHYLYCPHRWGLLEIDKAWAENAFVTKANIMHERVHNPENNYKSRGKQVFTSVSIYHDLEPYNLYGITDCIEVSRFEEGVSLNGSKEKYKFSIVEYKPTKPKNGDFREEDVMQVFAQKICVDYVFGCDSEAYLYYADVKRRVKLPLKENFNIYNKQLIAILEEMRTNLENGVIPPISKKQYCSGCSLKDLCIPKTKMRQSLKDEIYKIWDSIDDMEE